MRWIGAFVRVGLESFVLKLVEILYVFIKKLGFCKQFSVSLSENVNKLVL
ncbi:MAG: hypothetical protein ACD_82C00209G0001 [uncultured bacterium]|nr:MAG: hypothetical protein ACD_82C00209G0001 [uncultured bacterium]